MKSHKYTGSRLQQAKQVSRLAYEQSFSILPFITKHTTLSFIIRLNHKRKFQYDLKYNFFLKYQKFSLSDAVLIDFQVQNLDTLGPAYNRSLSHC